jgi:hypothetical protein
MKNQPSPRGSFHRKGRGSFHRMSRVHDGTVNFDIEQGFKIDGNNLHEKITKTELLICFFIIGFYLSI